MSKKFALSRHAKIRIDQRQLKDPNEIELQSVRGKMKKLIKKRCKSKGYAPDRYIYFQTFDDEYVTQVYVCAKLDNPGNEQFLVVTCFEFIKPEFIK